MTRGSTNQNTRENVYQQIIMDRRTFMNMLREVQRGQNHTGNAQNYNGQTMFDCFMKQRPNYFKEAKTPMDAKAWIDHMEKFSVSWNVQRWRRLDLPHIVLRGC